MNTVTFGEYNSYADLNLILSSKTIGSPSVKTSTIDLPGSDGELDFTEYFGGKNKAFKTMITGEVLSQIKLSAFAKKFFTETWTLDDIPPEYLSDVPLIDIPTVLRIYARIP